mgnify:CR=1 FL=1
MSHTRLIFIAPSMRFSLHNRCTHLSDTFHFSAYLKKQQRVVDIDAIDDIELSDNKDTIEEQILTSHFKKSYKFFEKSLFFFFRASSGLAAACGMSHTVSGFAKSQKIVTFLT